MFQVVKRFQLPPGNKDEAGTGLWSKYRFRTFWTHPRTALGAMLMLYNVHYVYAKLLSLPSVDLSYHSFVCEQHTLQVVCGPMYVIPRDIVVVLCATRWAVAWCRHSYFPVSLHGAIIWQLRLKSVHSLLLQGHYEAQNWYTHYFAIHSFPGIARLLQS